VSGFCGAYTPGTTAPAGGTYVDSIPDYTGPQFEVVPGTAPAPGEPGVNRAAQFAQYKAQLLAARQKVIIDLGSPGPGDLRTAVEAVADKVLKALDHTNWSLSLQTPVTVKANRFNNDWTWFNGVSTWSGKATLKNGEPMNLNGLSWYWRDGATWGPLSNWGFGNAGDGQLGGGFNDVAAILGGCGWNITSATDGGSNESSYGTRWGSAATTGCGLVVGASDGTTGGIGAGFAAASISYYAHITGAPPAA